MGLLFKVVVAIVSALVSAASLAFITFDIAPKASWPLIALISFVIFAIFVGWGWYSAEKSIRRLEREAANPALQKAQDKHLERVKKLIERWSNSLSIPPIRDVMPGTTSDMDNVKSDSCFVYLKGHLPFKELWQNFNEWDSNIQEYLDKCKALIGEIQESWEIDGTQATNSFAYPILKMIDGEELRFIMAYGEEPLEEVSGQMLSVNGIDVVHGNSFEGLECSACPSSTLGLEYQKLADKFLNKPLVAELKQLSSSLITKSSNIQESLRQILEKADYINHSCKNCPIKYETT